MVRWGLRFEKNSIFDKENIENSINIAQSIRDTKIQRDKEIKKTIDEDNKSFAKKISQMNQKEKAWNDFKTLNLYWKYNAP